MCLLFKRIILLPLIFFFIFGVQGLFRGALRKKEDVFDEENAKKPFLRENGEKSYISGIAKLLIAFAVHAFLS